MFQGLQTQVVAIDGGVPATCPSRVLETAVIGFAALDRAAAQVHGLAVDLAADQAGRVASQPMPVASHAESAHVRATYQLAMRRLLAMLLSTILSAPSTPTTGRPEGSSKPT